MRILTAVSQMQNVLASVDAPARQRRGVADWCADIALAVTAARQFRNPAGLDLQEQPGPALARRLLGSPTRFLEGEATHRAWVELCGAVISALGAQEAHAVDLLTAARRDERAAADLFSVNPTPHLQQRAREAARIARWAEEWRQAASTAAWAGQGLVRRENAFARPVGAAISRVGGLNHVARDRYYHQAGAL